MAKRPLILNRYRIVEMAGAGGMGSVYHAYDTRLKRDVAIKCIDLSAAESAEAGLLSLEEKILSAEGATPGPFSQTNTSQFHDDDLLPPQNQTWNVPDPTSLIPGITEAQMAAQLSDSHIVTVYDCEIVDSKAYVIMEYVEGQSLTELSEDLGDEISLDLIAAIFDGVSKALETAHRNGVLHLDIKPDNVIINREGIVKVADFGLATLVDASGSGTAGGGTIGYMPLEQIRQESLDGRTDEWALASLTYELLTGTNPFQVPRLSQAEAAILEADLVLPSSCWDELDPNVDDIIFDALAPQKEDRFPTIGAFSKKLSRYLGDEAKGIQELIYLLNDDDEEMEEEDETEEEYEPLPPLVDRLGVRGANIIIRALSAAGAMLLTFEAGINVHLEPGSFLGLIVDLPVLFWPVFVATIVLTYIKPTIGSIVSLYLVGIAIILNEAPVLGIGFMIGCLIWWMALGRRGSPQAMCALMLPQGGSVGFSAISPVLSGVLLPFAQAIGTTIFSVFLALVLATFGSHDLLGWNILIDGQFEGVDLQRNFLITLATPSTWCYAFTWLMATGSLCFFSWRGNQKSDVAGAFVAAAWLIAGAFVAAGLDSGGFTWLPSVFTFISSLFPGIVGIILAVLGVADRARWDESDWEALTRQLLEDDQ